MAAMLPSEDDVQTAYLAELCILFEADLPEVLVDVHQALEHPLPQTLLEFLPRDQTTDHGSISDNVFDFDGRNGGNRHSDGSGGGGQAGNPLSQLENGSRSRLAVPTGSTADGAVTAAPKQTALEKKMAAFHKKQISIPFKKPSKQKKRKRKDGEKSASRGRGADGLGCEKKSRIVAETPLKDQLEKGEDSGAYLHASSAVRRSPRLSKPSGRSGVNGAGANRSQQTSHAGATLGATSLSFSRGLKQGGVITTPRALKSKMLGAGADRRSSPRIRQQQAALQGGRRPPPQYTNDGEDHADDDDDDTVPSTPRDKKRRGPQRALSL